MPWPGWTTLTTIRPMTRASVVTTSKYSSAFSPTRPTSFMSPIFAMPTTTVQNTIGAIIILISLMKASPSGLAAVPVSGATAPRMTPTAMANRTWA